MKARRTKTILGLAAALLALACALGGLWSAERSRAGEAARVGLLHGMDRLQAALGARLSALRAQASDMARADGSPGAAQSGGADAVLLADASGRIARAFAHAPAFSLELAELLELYGVTSRERNPADSGIVLTAAGPVLFAAAPLPGPGGGTLVLAHLLDAGETAELGREASLDAAWLDLRRLPVDIGLIDVARPAPASGVPVAVRALGGGRLEGVGLACDPWGAPIGAWRISLDGPGGGPARTGLAGAFALGGVPALLGLGLARRGGKGSGGGDAGGAELSGLRVLVADDNAFNRELLTAVLEGAGASVVQAEDGVQAVLAVLEHGPDLALIDVRMPGMDGLEAARAIRSNPRCRELPVLGVSAGGGGAGREECLAAGMNGYLAKPVTRAALMTEAARLFPPGGARPALPPAGAALPAPIPASSSLPGVDGVDMARALALFDGDEALLARMLAAFPENFRGACARISALLEAGDARGAWIMAHGLKGAAAGIAAHGAGALAGRLEEQLAGGETGPAKRTLAQLDALLHDLFARIGEALGRKGSPGAGTEF